MPRRYDRQRRVLSSAGETRTARVPLDLPRERATTAKCHVRVRSGSNDDCQQRAEDDRREVERQQHDVTSFCFVHTACVANRVPVAQPPKVPAFRAGQRWACQTTHPGGEADSTNVEGLFWLWGQVSGVGYVVQPDVDRRSHHRASQGYMKLAILTLDGDKSYTELYTDTLLARQARRGLVAKAV